MMIEAVTDIFTTNLSSLIPNNIDISASVVNIHTIIKVILFAVTVPLITTYNLKSIRI